MSQFLLIEKIKVQNANAVSGFTWGFPSITHFLGFIHNLKLKLDKQPELSGIDLTGCVVIAHSTDVHCFETENGYLFSQNRSTNYLDTTQPAKTSDTPSIIEEAKMNMMVSLLVPIDGFLGGIEDKFKKIIKNACYLQRLAGGTILEIKNIELLNLSDNGDLKRFKYQLLPGFVLQDRSHYLEQHYLKLKENNPDVGLLDAWFDFITLKQKARPNCDLIDKYLAKHSSLSELNEIWLEHKSMPYSQNEVPIELINYFNEEVNLDSQILKQWHDYINPTEKTAANWEYLPKPEKGFLVPIMTGYKAISDVFPAGSITGARDSETDLCFVESVHSIGEWQSVHRLKTTEHWENSVWSYTPYEQDWYLCKQLATTDSVSSTQDNFDPYQ